MLSDPLPLGGLFTGGDPEPWSMYSVQVGPGAKVIRTARPGNALATIVGTVSVAGLTLTTSHDVIKGGRKRSLFRLDLTTRDSSTGEQYSQAAYLVLDRDPSAPQVAESTRRLLLHITGFLTDTNAVADAVDFSTNAEMTAFVNGEP